MSGPTGPQGQQGYRGFKGSRGMTGCDGWGYGTTTGPTGGIGNPTMVTLTISAVTPQTITLSAATSGRIYNLTGMTADGAIVYFEYPTLGSGDAGTYWMFYNSTAYNVNGSGSSLYVGPGQSITHYWSGTSLIGI